MKSTDMSPLLDADDISALKSTLKREESHVIKLPSPVNEAVDLFKRFQHEFGQSAPGSMEGTDASKVKGPR